MSFKYLSLTLASAVVADPLIQIMENGNKKDIYVVGAAYEPPKPSGTGFSLSHNTRVYLDTKNECGKFSADKYYQPNLLGGSIEYDFDISQAGCGCNAGMYMISMPGYDSAGNLLPSEGKDFYCDANKVGGVWCPEMDIMEANQYALHMTPHKCDQPNGKSYPSCDRGGCGKSIYEIDPTAWGPGSQYRINTLKQFHGKVEFQSRDQNSLQAIVQTFTQGSNTFQMTIADQDCASGYLQNMVKPLKDGMTLSMSSWGDTSTDMSWLDGETGCSGKCTTDPTVTYTNISYHTVDPWGPTPASPDCPKPSPWSWGNGCKSASADECGSNCTLANCKFSWPRDDPKKWDSHDAHCRCDTETDTNPFIQY